MKSLFVIVLFGISSSFSFAQAPPGFNSSFMQMQMHQMLMQLNSRNWYRNGNYLENPKYQFRVTMKDGSMREVYSKIHTDTILRSSFLLYVNKKVSRKDSLREERIYPSQTKKIGRFLTSTTSSPAKLLEGAATDSCWQFPAISGKITAYSFLSEQFSLNTYYLNAFKFFNEPVQSFDVDKLKEYICDNEKAMKAFQKKDYYKAIIRYNQAAYKKTKASVSEEGDSD